jgi:threonine synthase
VHFSSTRDSSHSVSLSDAIDRGLAPDGGLYMPNVWPAIDVALAGESLPSVAAQVVAPFARGDALEDSITEICAAAFTVPAPVVHLADRLSVLELFHGPTAAFKDFGARFLAQCVARVPRERPLDILVATSGDTGGAVAAAFQGHEGVRVTLLYPHGMVSPAQQRQLTCWGDHVLALAVRGTFDDCQRMVKEAFGSSRLRERYHLSSANSINIGRLLPQAAYYAATSLANARAHGDALSFIIPSGNVGNAVGAMIARRLGFPIDRIVLAHNANRTVPDFLASGRWEPRPGVATIATAMDVGDPSNMERVRAMFPDVAELRREITAVSVDDTAIRARIAADFRARGQVWCPHTATAAEAWARLSEDERRNRRWCLVATAHPAKFPETIEPLIGRPVEEPAALRALRDRPTQYQIIAPTPGALEEALNR